MAFAFRLQNLLTYREHQRERVRQTLAVLLRQDADLLQRREQFMAERAATVRQIEERQQRPQLDVDQLAARRYHAGHLTVEVRLVDYRRGELAQQIAACRTHLLQADQAVKALEKLSDRQRLEQVTAAERLEQRGLEEAWQAGRLVQPEAL